MTAMHPGEDPREYVRQELADIQSQLDGRDPDTIGEPLTITEPEVISLDMICRCSPEGKAEADALREEVKRRLSERADAEVSDSDFLTHVVVSLNWDYGAEITGIHNDMWSLVGAETWLPSRRVAGDWLKVSIQCDDVEDGIAAVWKAFADRASAVGSKAEDTGS